MATKVVWDRSPEPDMDHYDVYVNGTKVATVAQTAAGVKPEWTLVGEGNVSVKAVDMSGNESEMSVSRPFDKKAPAAPVNLVFQ